MHKSLDKPARRALAMQAETLAGLPERRAERGLRGCKWNLRGEGGLVPHVPYNYIISTKEFEINTIFYIFIFIHIDYNISS